GGNDTITVIPGTNFAADGIKVRGGDSDDSTDTLILTTAAGTAESINMSSDGTTTTITGLGGAGGASLSVTGVEAIQYAGAGGDDDLTVQPNGGSDTMRVARDSGFDVVTSSTMPRIKYAGVNNFAVSGFGVNPLNVVFATPFLGGAVNY